MDFVLHILKNITTIDVFTFSLVNPFDNPSFNRIVASPSPTPITIEQPSLTPVPTTASKLQQKTYIAPTVDPDPPVVCNISANCGGGTTPLKQSECPVQASVPPTATPDLTSTPVPTETLIPINTDSTSSGNPIAGVFVLGVLVGLVYLCLKWIRSKYGNQNSPPNQGS